MQLINGLILIAGLTCIVFFLALAKSNPQFWILAVFGFLLILMALYFDHQRKKAELVARTNKQRQLLENIANTPWSTGEELTIDGDRGIALLLLGAIASGGYASSQISNGNLNPVSLVSWPIAALCLFTLIIQLSTIRKPILILGTDGLLTPFFGLISWHRIEGIRLETSSHRGIQINVLSVKIPSLGESIEQIHWIPKALAAVGLGSIKRGSIGINLRQTNQDPVIIHAVARMLWQHSIASTRQESNRAQYD